jgi:prepilin-type processing-associated H-X9-DG protein
LRLIAIADIRDPKSVDFAANIDPMPDPNGVYSQLPSIRHNYRTDILFADGHVEPVKGTDMVIGRDPWVRKWNNDYSTTGIGTVLPSAQTIVLDPSY